MKNLDVLENAAILCLAGSEQRRFRNNDLDNSDCSKLAPLLTKQCLLKNTKQGICKQVLGAFNSVSIKVGRHLT